MNYCGYTVLLTGNYEHRTGAHVIDRDCWYSLQFLMGIITLLGVNFDRRASDSSRQYHEMDPLYLTLRCEFLGMVWRSQVSIQLTNKRFPSPFYGLRTQGTLIKVRTPFGGSHFREYFYFRPSSNE